MDADAGTTDLRRGLAQALEGLERRLVPHGGSLHDRRVYLPEAKDPNADAKRRLMREAFVVLDAGRRAMNAVPRVALAPIDAAASDRVTDELAHDVELDLYLELLEAMADVVALIGDLHARGSPR